MAEIISGFVEAKLGCDPEVFLRKKIKGRWSIVPSAELLPKGQIVAPSFSGIYYPKIVRDGVQVELHPEPYTCRANLSNSIQRVFQTLKAAVEKADLKVDFSGTVRLTKAEMRRLDPESAQLGCMPSLNAYGRRWIEKDGSRYPWRSGGGHIHIELFPTDQFMPDYTVARSLRNRKFDLPELVRWLDLMVGIPCVLLDRDPLNAQRRKLYGRAGEYRTPPHGLEYRTLSNFWLRSYPIMSLVFGMVHNALNMWPATQPIATKEELEEIKQNRNVNVARYYNDYGYPEGSQMRVIVGAARKCPTDLLEKAINKNDFDLAMELYVQFVKPVWENTISARGIDKDRVKAFEWLVENGIDKVFKDDPLTHWATKGEGHNGGWESFAYNVLASGYKPVKGVDNGANQHPTQKA